MIEYRGFEIAHVDGHGWYAVAGDGLITLGPFTSENEAKRAVNRELGE